MKKSLCFLLVILCVPAMIFPAHGEPAGTGVSDRIGPDIPTEDPFMKEAIGEALDGILRREGGPFGAVVVRDGEIVGRGHNRVLAAHDPTSHGEITAIRDACANLETHDLTGCVLYTTGEPCPMCLFACMWANIDRVRYGCTVEDSAGIGFRDEDFGSLVDRTALGDYLICTDRDACLVLYGFYLTLEPELY